MHQHWHQTTTTKQKSKQIERERVSPRALLESILEAGVTFCTDSPMPHRSSFSFMVCFMRALNVASACDASGAFVSPMFARCLPSAFEQPKRPLSKCIRSRQSNCPACEPGRKATMASNLVAMASNLIAMASNKGEFFNSTNSVGNP